MIHKEGYASLVIAILVLFVFNLGLYPFVRNFEILQIGGWVVSGILFLIVLQFFRYPNRKANIDEGVVLCPADGKVVVIEEVEETEYFKDRRIQVSIFMSPTNVHANWAPIKGKVVYANYHPGQFLVAWHPKSSTENERTTFVFENEKRSVLVRQIAGALARRIVYYAEEGQMYNQGQEFGFIKFGSRVDLFLPLGTKINVELGQKVTGKKTVVATFA
ncbi:MAG: phosphatidylserine decarboxylase family protein [Flavobacteriales bacterium]|nr:phosphatidylserine decarboxylase family protein [Flavobacteriales bacterium]